MKARWTTPAADSVPSPSIVLIWRAGRSAIGGTQEKIALPATITVHAPHCPQPQLDWAKFGCGFGQCGGCTVMVAGKAIFSCVTPIALLPARQIKTIEGLGTESAAGVVQRAFIDEQAAQCGYCIAGMVMRAQALLERNPSPTEDQIREAMMPNLCR